MKEVFEGEVFGVTVKGLNLRARREKNGAEGDEVESAWDIDFCNDLQWVFRTQRMHEKVRITIETV